MYHLKLTLRNITPIFMYGENSKTFELRSAEFKGLIRFWWRAVKASDDLDALRKEETKIFGGISGKKAVKSAVKLSLKEKFGSGNIGSDLENEFAPKSKPSKDDIGSIYYLLYSVARNKYLKPMSQFELTISARDEHPFKNAAAALWTLIYFGGVGSRSRRGGGNLYVEKADGKTAGLDFIPKAGSPEQLAAWLKENFQKVQEIISPAAGFCASYSNLNFSRFVISKEAFNGWREAMADIGKKYKNFRFKHKSSIISGSLGLPVVHGIRDKNITKVIGTETKSQDSQGRQEKFDRRASPLVIKILKIQDKYYWLALRLAGEFLPQNARLFWKKDKQSQSSSQQTGSSQVPPSYKILDDFWAELKKSSLGHVLSMPKELKEIKEQLIKNLKSASKEPQKIIIYGPWARGDAHKGEKINIAIDAGQPLGSALSKINMPKVDLSDLTAKGKELEAEIQHEAVELYRR